MRGQQFPLAILINRFHVIQVCIVPFWCPSKYCWQGASVTVQHCASYSHLLLTLNYYEIPKGKGEEEGMDKGERI